jgi:hypothetical protein
LTFTWVIPSVFQEMKSSCDVFAPLPKPCLGATAVAGSLVIVALAAQAITIPVACGENALVAAVNLANSTPISDTLVLAGGCTYGMTTRHGGPANALPVITTPIDDRSRTVTNAPLLELGLFRIAEVGPTGSLSLTTGVAFTRGNVVGNGGGILNRGAVTLTGSTLTGNTASGNGGGPQLHQMTAAPANPRQEPQPHNVPPIFWEHLIMGIVVIGGLVDSVLGIVNGAVVAIISAASAVVLPRLPI